MKLFSSDNKRPTQVFIHIIAWMLIFVLPILMSGDKLFTHVDWGGYLRYVKMPFNALVVFYLNYFLLVPRLLLKKKTQTFIGSNLLLVLLISLVLHIGEWKKMNRPPLFQEDLQELREKHKEEIGSINDPDQLPERFRHKVAKNRPPRWSFVILDSFWLLCAIGLSAAIRMNGEWNKAETALQEAKKAKAEAELNNLRNQLNPHFLLNTLNNIYALIAFDSDKAQQAVQDLSKLLRYVLYENQQTYVPLSREVEFISNYIELMRIRLKKEVKVYINFNVPANSTVQIAPLIFISLIENAFKHGISPTEPSFISISLSQIEQKEVRCEILNSNFPKNNRDKSGSGIGLEQVRKRLELLYPGKYTWKKEVNEQENVYSSILTIDIS